MNPCRSKHRAFATTTAIVFIGFVGVALALMATRLSMEVDRGQRLADEAQLRQLLLAGMLSASQTANDAATKIQLPEGRGNVELTTKVDDAGMRHTLIVARYRLVEQSTSLASPLKAEPPDQ